VRTAQSISLKAVDTSARAALCAWLVSTPSKMARAATAAAIASARRREERGIKKAEMRWLKG